MTDRVTLRCTYLGDNRCRFLVWAPLADSVAVQIIAPGERVVPLTRCERGYHRGEITGIEPGSLYYYLLDGEKRRPDPASRFQPRGVHGPSQVVDHRSFTWTDHCWFGPDWKDLIFYELHVGTFTPEGTFEAIIPHLPGLRDLGVSAIELMPLAQFPGSRNWGYDGVYPFAVQSSYGGPRGLRRLVDSCHRQGLAVFVDVVYNHLGPEGNYLNDFGPYFTDRYITPWGQAINFDGAGSDEVRRFFIENALYWLTGFHIDGLRLDAVHAVTDKSALPFLEEIASVVRRTAEKLGRRIYLVAESDLNDPRLIRPRAANGFGLDGQWSDDYHHSLYSLLTGERKGYYRDYGRPEHLVRALRTGYTYTGQYSVHRERRHGTATHLCDSFRFVVFCQNHDQVGNRAFGKRLSHLVPFEGLKLAAASVILSPFLPLLFMGEEYGETAPFQYFTSHSDPALVEAVRKGRREEFASFGWASKAPDPQDVDSFRRSCLDRGLVKQDPHGTLFRFYRELIHLRRKLPALSDLSFSNMEAGCAGLEPVIFMKRWSGDSEVFIILSFSDHHTAIDLPVPAGKWRKILDSAEAQWQGEGSRAPGTLDSPGLTQIALNPLSCLMFAREA